MMHQISFIDILEGRTKKKQVARATRVSNEMSPRLSYLKYVLVRDKRFLLLIAIRSSLIHNAVFPAFLTLCNV